MTQVPFRFCHPKWIPKGTGKIYMTLILRSTIIAQEEFPKLHLKAGASRYSKLIISLPIRLCYKNAGAQEEFPKLQLKVDTSKYRKT